VRARARGKDREGARCESGAAEGGQEGGEAGGQGREEGGEGGEESGQGGEEGGQGGEESGQGREKSGEEGRQENEEGRQGQEEEVNAVAARRTERGGMGRSAFRASMIIACIVHASAIAVVTNVKAARTLDPASPVIGDELSIETIESPQRR